MDKDDDFSNITFNPTDLWTLSDDHYHDVIKGPLFALHKNLTRASGDERNHKASNVFIVAHELGWASTI